MKNIINKKRYRIPVALLLWLGMLTGCTSKEERFLKEVSQAEAVESTEISPSESPQEESLTAEETEQETLIFVDVCGAVRVPGVYELPEGSRVFQAIEAAGGLLENARTDLINQAQVLSDGQQVRVWTQEEAEQNPAIASADPMKGDETDQVDLNAASAEDLCRLPGIGESKAQAIIKYRETHGPFTAPEELMQVEGIKQGTFDKMKDQIIIR